MDYSAFVIRWDIVANSTRLFELEPRPEIKPLVRLVSKYVPCTDNQVRLSGPSGRRVGFLRFERFIDVANDNHGEGICKTPASCLGR